jgi:adenosylmethionine-8-amino-7-oxononanoate aminotransferase
MITDAQASLAESLVALDRAHLIHPVANWRGHEQRGATVLQSGRGAWLRDENGRELLDAFSGLWCVNIGYGHESVVQAATRQMRKLPYATGYFGFSSEPAIRLAAKLTEIAPAGLNHVYLTLGGSEAVDAAVRLIVQYYNAIGRPTKKHFISLERGYHGSPRASPPCPPSTAASTCRVPSSTTSPRPMCIATRRDPTRRR